MINESVRFSLGTGAQLSHLYYSIGNTGALNLSQFYQQTDANEKEKVVKRFSSLYSRVLARNSKVLFL